MNEATEAKIDIDDPRREGRADNMNYAAEAEIDFDDPVVHSRRKLWKKVLMKMRRSRGRSIWQSDDDLVKDKSIGKTVSTAMKKTKSGFNKFITVATILGTGKENHDPLEEEILPEPMQETESETTQEDSDESSISDAVLKVVEETKRLSKNALEATKKTTSELEKMVSEIAAGNGRPTSPLPEKWIPDIPDVLPFSAEKIRKTSWFNTSKSPHPESPIRSSSPLAGRNPVDFDKCKDYESGGGCAGNNKKKRISLAGRNPVDFNKTDPYVNPVDELIRLIESPVDESPIPNPVDELPIPNPVDESQDNCHQTQATQNATDTKPPRKLGPLELFASYAKRNLVEQIASKPLSRARPSIIPVFL